jgi:hypothetical protein
MFVQLDETNRVIEVINYDDISDKFHPDFQALLYPVEGEIELNDYVILTPREGLKDLATKTDPPLVEPSVIDPLDVLRSHMAFGQRVIENFIIGNLALGITAEQSGPVIDSMSGIDSALRAGALELSMMRIKQLPAESKDSTFVTDARLLEGLNQIEEFLGLPLSETL